jgi:hypothetical protein
MTQYIILLSNSYVIKKKKKFNYRPGGILASWKKKSRNLLPDITTSGIMRCRAMLSPAMLLSNCPDLAETIQGNNNGKQQY